MIGYEEAVILDQIWRIEAGGKVEVKTRVAGDAAYKAQRARTLQADREHEHFMQFLAKELKVERGSVQATITYMTKKRLAELSEKYAAVKLANV